MKSQLLKKRADVLNEVLADPKSGEERPASPDSYDNPFASKTREEPRVAAITQHQDTKFLPPRPENQSHLDKEVKKELDMEKEKTASPDWMQVAQSLTPTDIKLLKIVKRFSGQDLTQMIQFTGMTSQRLMGALNNLARKGYIGVKDNKPVATSVTDGLLMATSTSTGSVVATWKASLLIR